MSYLTLLILAPVYLETLTESEDNDVSKNVQDGSDFMCLCELTIESTVLLEKCQPVTHTPRNTKFDLLSSLPSQLQRCYLDFPFLTDRKTFAYLNNKDTKVMFIMRGLSGSGKSSIVNIILSSFKHVLVCSADDYFYNEDGHYLFDQGLLSAAHTYCQQKAKQACNEGVPVIVIDNTNVKRWEHKFYINLANMGGYVVVLVQPRTPWRFNAGELAARNKHGVTAEILQQKVAMFDDVVPAYYGWFLNERQSKCLNRLCLDVYLECFSKCPQLRQDLLRELKIKLEDTDEETGQGVLSRHYSSGVSRSPLLHCTARYCARGKTPDAKNYHKRPDIQQACGQVFSLAITGLVITNKTIGARVSLGESASAFFSHPEEEEWGSQSLSLPRGGHPLGIKDQSFGVKRQQLGMDKVDDTGVVNDQMLKRGNRKAHKNQQKFLKTLQKKDSVTRDSGGFHVRGPQIGQLESAAVHSDSSETDSSLNLDMPDISENTVLLSDLFPSLNLSGQTRSAHLTIKTSKGVESREVNFDILHACDVETCSVYTRSDLIPVSRGHACYYGDGLCCVYFNKPLNVQTLFSGFY